MRGRLLQAVTSPKLPAAVTLMILMAVMGRIADRVPVLDPRGVTEQAAIVVTIAGLTLARPRQRSLRGLVAIATATSLMALVAGVVLLEQTKTTFTSCVTVLQDVSSTSATRTCERSYDQPLSRFRTRSDSTIDFGSSKGLAESIGDTNWDISALNSLRYNFRSKAEGPSRGRIPFRVQWTGIPDASGSLLVRYVGEGKISSGAVSNDLPPSYESAAEVTVPYEHNSDLLVDYVWDPPDHTDGPFAAISLLDSKGEAVGAKADPLISLLVVLASVLVAVTLLVLVALAVLVLARAQPSRPAGWFFWLSVGLLLVTLLMALSRAPGASQSIWELPIAPMATMLLLMLVAIHFPPAPTRVVAWTLIPAVSLLYVSKYWTSPGDVIYRAAGDDFLTYESFAREILETGSLQGGEDVFVYSPAIRYWLFLQHVVFGDADRPIFVVSLILLMGAAWFSIRVLVTDRIRVAPTAGLSWRDPAMLAAFASVALFSALIGYRVTWTGGAILLSEYPTWPLLIAALTLTLRGRLDDRTLAIIGFLMVLALLFRFNQLPGIVAILVTAALLASRHRFGRVRLRYIIRVAAPLVLPLLVLGILPLIHNLTYGNRWVPFQTSLPLPQNFPLPPQRLLDWNSDPTVAQTLIEQIGGVVVANDQISALSPLAFIARVVQVAGVVLLSLGVWHKLHGPWKSVLWLGIPVAFLLPHIFVQVYMYYPRHVIAGYLTANVVLLALAGQYVNHRHSPLKSGEPTRH